MRANRQKQPVTWTLDPEIIERLKAWISRQEIRHPQNAVVEQALKRFLDEAEGAGAPAVQIDQPRAKGA